MHNTAINLHDYPRVRLWRLSRQILHATAIDLEVGDVVISTDIQIHGSAFAITNPVRDELYTSDNYAHPEAMVHDLIVLLLEGIP